MKSDATNAVPQAPAAKKETVQHSAAFKRKRKMLVMLPLICLPFISLAFWALGGGKETADNPQTTTAGLLLNLPDSKLKEADPTDKLRFYEQAEKDSLKLEEWMRTDPYYRQRLDSNHSSTNELQLLTQETASKYNYGLNSSPYSNKGISSEDELMRKLALLQEQLGNTPSPEKNASPFTSNEKESSFNTEIDRLNLIMQQMQNSGQENPELKAIQGTLEKIIDIQHPERVKEKLKEQSTKQRNVVFPVTANKKTTVTSLLDSTTNEQQFQVGFFGIDETNKVEEESTAIEAVVHTTQTLVNGSIIQMRVATDIFINGTLIPKGTKLNGKVSLNDERLEINISSLRYGKHIFPIELEVFDMDGMAGIYIPGAISRDVAKESAQSSLQQMDILTLDPSFRAQAATAGVNTLKQLLGRKVKQVKVVVKEGHRLLLRDKKREQQLSSNNN
ncbi:conjugative transposon TraM protein [Lacibacter cauensis]|uniref:Conjugative transposon TraM protein n=1 Tax=Lacibacter cauensis TaxID=510947 RepID=A0A562SCZ1_9BACT|nr:conjugative transposon protein TraM [Lacibacter cauensis]TWI79053.1 conjugative transposon TraM protein [Lacibacter cauensis]